MITERMQQLAGVEPINEKWAKSIPTTPGGKKTIDVFMNPESKEVVEMIGKRDGVRYLLPKSGSGDVYAWSDASPFIHNDMREILKLNLSDYYWMHFYFGYRPKSEIKPNAHLISEIQLMKEKPFRDAANINYAVNAFAEKISKALKNKNAAAIVRRGLSVDENHDQLLFWLLHW